MSPARGPPPASALGTPGRLRPGCLRAAERPSGGAQRPPGTAAPLCPPPPPPGAASAPLHVPAPPVPQPPPPGRIPRSRLPAAPGERRNSAPGNRQTGPAGNSRPRAPAFPRLSRRGARSREGRRSAPGAGRGERPLPGGRYRRRPRGALGDRGGAVPGGAQRSALSAAEARPSYRAGRLRPRAEPCERGLAAPGSHAGGRAGAQVGREAARGGGVRPRTRPFPLSGAPAAGPAWGRGGRLSGRERRLSCPFWLCSSERAAVKRALCELFGRVSQTPSWTRTFSFGPRHSADSQRRAAQTGGSVTSAKSSSGYFCARAVCRPELRGEIRLEVRRCGLVRLSTPRAVQRCRGRPGLPHAVPFLPQLPAAPPGPVPGRPLGHVRAGREGVAAREVSAVPLWCVMDPIAQRRVSVSPFCFDVIQFKAACQLAAALREAALRHEGSLCMCGSAALRRQVACCDHLNTRLGAGSSFPPI